MRARGRTNDSCGSSAGEFTQQADSCMSRGAQRRGSDYTHRQGTCEYIIEIFNRKQQKYLFKCHDDFQELNSYIVQL